jgi:hypothetical protein
MDYVEEVCGIPGRTARRYMELAEQKPLIEQRLGGKMANLATLTQTDVKRMISTRLPKANERTERTIKFETIKKLLDKAPPEVRKRFEIRPAA